MDWLSAAEEQTREVENCVEATPGTRFTRLGLASDYVLILVHPFSMKGVLNALFKFWCILCAPRPHSRLVTTCLSSQMSILPSPSYCTLWSLFGPKFSVLSCLLVLCQFVHSSILVSSFTAFWFGFSTYSLLSVLVC